MQDFETQFQADLIGLLPHLRAFARTLAGDAAAADDLVQETMLKAWHARQSYTMGTNMKAWTFMILRNQFYSGKRRSWREHHLDPEIAERTLVACDDQTRSMDLADLRRAMMSLCEEQREALILIGAAGLSYEEAAEITGCAIGTIKSRVSRARSQLAAILEAGVLPDGDVAPRFAFAAIMADADRIRSAA